MSVPTEPAAPATATTAPGPAATGGETDAPTTGPATAVSAESTNAPAQDATDAAPATPSVTSPASTAAAPAEPAASEPAGKAPTIQGEFDPARASKTIANLRGRETRLQQELAEQKATYDEFTKGLAKLIGLGEEEPPDPAMLTQQLTASQSETKQARVELAVWRMSGELGADPDAVLDSRAFGDAVGRLDPSAADFAEQVQAALAAAVEANPRLRALPAAPATPAAGAAGDAGAGSPAAGVSGAAITAATEGGPITAAQLQQAHERGDSPLIARWHAEGRLAHLL